VDRNYIYDDLHSKNIYICGMCVCLCTVQCCRYPDWREAASNDRHLELYTLLKNPCLVPALVDVSNPG
jgi:hypothetical protein